MAPRQASQRRQFGQAVNGPPELPDELITYASQEYAPPRKRQKTSTDTPAELNNGAGSQQQENGTVGESLDYITVGQSKWEVKCNSSKLSGIQTPLEITNVKTYVGWAGAKPRHISLRYANDGSPMVMDFPEDSNGLDEDVRLALDIHRESSKWSKYQGKIWTEFEFALLQREGVDHIQVIFTIKWNVTTSIHNIPKNAQKMESLKRMMERYFPDPNVTQSDTWTPQDFYQSVHTPDKDDSIASTIHADIHSDLFPFQKRAVRWLLLREGKDWTERGIQPRDSGSCGNDILPHGFQRTKNSQGMACFTSSLYGCTTLDLQPFQNTCHDIRGGILAEEMGLGKTLETIALITLHRRPQQGPTVFDPYTFTNVHPIGATLIVCPAILVQQWISEVRSHSNLKVVHYEGIGTSLKAKNADQLRDDIANSDVVVTTYAVLAGEINYTFLNPEKSLRRESKYKRPKSPLMEFSWWRICIDEAQMVESGVSNAATVARIIPRVNAWCITGTPVRRDITDLLGLLIFLRVEPYATAKHVWSSLTSTHKSEFRRLFGLLALRHNKKTVRNELNLPAQKRYVITMPFTPIEEQHYQELFRQMCLKVGLDADGQPTRDDWDPDQAAASMRKW
jgi:E3 ubiquitin-protein ligase SHPRH